MVEWLSVVARCNFEVSGSKFQETNDTLGPDNLKTICAEIGSLIEIHYYNIVYNNEDYYDSIITQQEDELLVDGYEVALRDGGSNPLDDISAHDMINTRCILAWNFIFLRSTRIYTMLNKAIGRRFTIT